MVMGDEEPLIGGDGSNKNSTDDVDALQKMGRFKLSRRQALQASVLSAFAGLAADGTKLLGGFAEAGKLSKSGVMLRVSQIAEYDERLLGDLGRLLGKEQAKGLVLPWRLVSEQVEKLLIVTELESLPGCEKAVERLLDIKRIAETSTGELAAADLKSVAESYGQVRREIQAAFNSLPSELRAAGQLEMQELVAAENEFLIAEEKQLLEMEQAAVVEADLMLKPESTVLKASELIEIQEAIWRDAAELPKGALASSSTLSKQSMLTSVNTLLEGFKLESAPGGGKAVRSLKQVKKLIERGEGELTQADLRTMADNLGRARTELQVGAKFSPLALQREALEKAKEFVAFAKQNMGR